MEKRLVLLEMVDQAIARASEQVQTVKASTHATLHNDRTITTHLETITKTLEDIMRAVEVIGAVTAGQLEAMSVFGDTLEHDD
jgi:hypothetical protein